MLQRGEPRYTDLPLSRIPLLRLELLGIVTSGAAIYGLLVEEAITGPRSGLTTRYHEYTVSDTNDEDF
jgi:hypothetical protein